MDDINRSVTICLRYRADRWFVRLVPSINAKTYPHFHRYVLFSEAKSPDKSTEILMIEQPGAEWRLSKQHRWNWMYINKTGLTVSIY